MRKIKNFDFWHIAHIAQSYGFCYYTYFLLLYIQFPATTLLNLFEEPNAVIAESYCICTECEVCLLFTVIQYQLLLLGSGDCYRAEASGIGFRPAPFLTDEH